MKKIMMIMVMLAMTGCATQTYHINGGSAAAPSKDSMQNFFVYGIAQTQEMDASSICGGADKVIKVETKLEFVDWFLRALTGGLYSPLHAKVYCKK